jgi:hypothetical protein
VVAQLIQIGEQIMALQYRVFKAASSGASFTQRAKTAVTRVIEQIPSPSLDGLRAAIRASRGQQQDDRAQRVTDGLRAAAGAPSKIGPRPTYPPTQAAPAAPDLTAAIRAARKGKKR